MGVVDMSNPPSSHTKDFLATPALSLSLAGIFRDVRATAATAVEVEGRDGESGGYGGKREDTVEISSENSGPTKSRSEDDYEAEGEHDDEEDEDTHKMKKRKKYHRHTAQQIKEMEALFKESPHPDEKQRQELSKQLGLHPRQVKFWFQNRRTQIKAIQERHENSLLKTEMEKIREENKVLRETIKKSCCLSCGFATSRKDATEEQQLRIENARLKEELEKLRTAIGKCNPRASPNSSCSSGNEQGIRSSLDFSTGIFGHEMSRIMDAVEKATDELKKMATSSEPLWIRSYETGREILNYDAYMKEFPTENSSNRQPKTCIEASRETRIIFVDLPRIIQSFMDVNQWKELFPCLISKAATVYVMSNGEGVNRDGAVQLMFAELQMLTPVVATREVYFVRCCKQLSADQWAIIDVSIDKVEDNIDASLAKCRKRPSGCIIQDTSNGHCKVTWVEHLECQKTTVHSLYRTIVNSGLAFGAKHWIVTLQQQCERLVFFMATNVPIKDSSGIATTAGRKSILKLAQRMTWSYCRALGASSYNTWSKIPSKTGDDIRVASRKNINDPGEPLGVILCAVSSVWLPISHHVLFDFLRDENHRNEWDIMSNGSPVQCIGNLAKGQDRGNAVTIQAMKTKDQNMWILQDSCTNAYESMVVYAPVDVNGMQSVIAGCDSSNIAVLSSGFSILPDGIESRSLVITSRPEEKSTEGGSLLTIAFQILASNSLTAKLSMESIDSVNTLISCTLQNIKRILQCEE
ncbi:homeobox-leucine zipper protein GLABRA 2 [Olea europaea var. sylvestris]|uniref:Homeobox-leucine zipper GLABRA 2 n=2 Tax=Olea europaea subsp. europaea TaxID=158383 RepID=A0A8S0R6U0_OLEEU|nr:homeobox-leucine zipper protein GLABRA 2 [Olea europaea var. sylvestris]CAA2974534.1 homeobox-leucine zipper GLABRA 2 [Olea europaea subsp. europaea]